MITPFQVYLILMLDSICMMTTLIAALLALITCVIAGISVDSDVRYECREWARKQLKCLIPVFVLSLLLAIFIPNTEQAATIFLVPKVLNNEKVQDIGQNGLDLANNLLKLSNEYIEKNLITEEKTK